MNIFMRFPDGKPKALTLSYDDGVAQDIKLIKILNPYGIKATFNINSGCFSPFDAEEKGRMSKKQVEALYKNCGHEVAVHGYSHPFLEQLPLPCAIEDVIKDRRILEEIFATPIRGMAYPFGTYSDELILALKGIGIAYSRTTEATHDFRIPNDWLRLSTTCHHDDKALPELCDRFISSSPDTEDSNRSPWLFYLWGHSYEFDDHNNWHVIEAFAEKMGNKADVWYATNIQVFDYIEAYNRLKFSINGNFVYNPSAVAVWFEKDRKLIKVSAGEILEI